MRQIKYLSPTSIALWERDRTEFYLRYCAENRPPKIPQTHPMAIGSAFDAFVKNYIVGALLGSTPAQFEIEAIFEQQVESQNRDWALLHGERLFNAYQASGALADLMLELSQAITEPRFEFEIESRIPHERHIDGIPLLGKPDAHAKLKGGHTLTIDWKVNGYCSNSPVSPKKGYIKERPSGKSHRDCQTMMIGGIPVNIAQKLEDVDKDFATQLCIYMWVLGEVVPTGSIAGIEQVCCTGHEQTLGTRFASHRMKIGHPFQLSLLDRIATIWDYIQRGWIFTELSLQDSQTRGAMLDLQYLAYLEASTPQDKWFQDITRGGY